VPGEVSSPTQPFPVAPPPLSPQHLEVWGATEAESEDCRRQVDGLRAAGVFTPPAIRGTVAIPGNLGGLNWSGYAFDPGRGLLIANTNNVPYEVRLIPREDAGASESRLIQAHAEYGAQAGTPYVMYRRLLFSAANRPCTRPPWGTLTAVDMVRGTIRWQVPLGTFNLAGPNGPPGTVSLGGPIVTGGGLVFIAGTVLDSHFRAFDIETGRQLWSAELPAGGHATPMTYEFRGKQYVVIAAGGHAKVPEEPQGDALVAFALR
jgi:quinoprotein glucose dehydrogenase